MTRAQRWVLLGLSFGLVAGCSRGTAGEDNSAPSPETQSPRLQTSGQPEDLTFAPALRVNLERMTRTVSGLYYQDLLVGRGDPAVRGQRVMVAYSGWLADGAMFDQSPAGRPFAFQLGQGMVIPGWDEGVAGMKVGGRRLLVIPPALAYGRRSPGAGIPPNATLIFDVRLERIQP